MNHLLLRSSTNLCHQDHGFSNVLRSLLFSTSTLRNTSTSSFSGPRETLRDRITNAEGENGSVIPVIEKWLQDGGRIFARDLRKSIKNLLKRSRFGHALERKRGNGEPQTPGDIAVRLDLISKVYGLEEAEKYFNRLPHWMRYVEVYRSLLSCYVDNNHLEKAEAMMKRMRQMGSQQTQLYNLMLALYCQMGKYDKLDILMQEMESKGIRCNTCTFKVQLSCYANSSNIVGMEKILRKMKIHPDVSIDWDACNVAAKGYLKAGLNEKAITMLKESEPLIKGHLRNYAYEVSLSLYADAGSKDDLYRLWDSYKKSTSDPNSSYLRMLSALMKLGDIDGAERIWEDWLLRKTSFNSEIANAMISGYSKHGLWEKAEAFVNKAVNSGLELYEHSWDCLATGYRIGGQIVKAVEAIKKAVSIRKPGWKPRAYTLGSCLEGLKGQGDVEAAEELLSLVMERCPLRPDLYDKFKTMIERGNMDSGALDQMEGDDQAFNGVTPEKMEAEDDECAKLI